MFQILFGAIAVLLVVLGGDFVFPRLDKTIGMFRSDLVESAVIAAILWIIAVRQMRILTNSVVELDELRSRFYAEAIHDALSGLFNRRHFDQRLSEEFERARRYKLPLALVVIDVDHFKNINDQYGHPVGDSAIRELARRLGARHRLGDILARIGGEEFAVLLPSLRVAGASVFAEEVRRIIAEEPFHIASRGSGGVTITVSCGVTEIRADDEFPFALLRRADEALYEAKKTRNAVAAR